MWDQPVPVIPKLAKILDEYRASMHNPATGVMFHIGNGECLDMDKLAQRVIRPAIEAIRLPCVSGTPFGLLVVPLVCRNSATSLAFGADRSRFGAAWPL